MSKKHVIIERSNILNTSVEVNGTLVELIAYYQDVLKTGFDAWQSLKGGRKKVNTNPKSINSLIQNINSAFRNASNMKNDNYKCVELLKK